MPEGLQYVLSSKVSEFPRISVVGYETGPSLFVDRFIQEAVTNCLDVAEGNRAHLHLILLSSYDVNGLRLPLQRTDITTYEFARGPTTCEDLETLYEVIVKNVEGKPGGTHIMLIDDYAMFSIVYGARDTRSQAHFLRLISKRFRKMFIFFQKESLSKEEIGMIYDISTDIAFLQLHPDSYGPVCTNNSKFVCDLLKIRTDRRVTHDKTLLQITEDEIKEELIIDSSDKGGNGGSEVLKNLTTFKLTLEDDERESKNMLHLPYFEAQKTSLEDPENFDDFDEDDEEDEEV